MKYNKPEILRLGDANRMIESICVPAPAKYSSQVDGNCDHTSSVDCPSYELDD